MTSYVVKRVLQAIVSIAALLTVVFFLSRVTGDPDRLYLPIDATDEVRAAFREAHNLDDSLVSQYRNFAADVFNLDFGVSIWRRQGALSVVLERLGATVRLALLTTSIALPVGLVLGTAAGLRPTRARAKVVAAAAAASASIPDFWVGLLLIWGVAIKLGWLPTSGAGGVEFMILPAVTLSLAPIGVIALITRSGVERERSSTHVRAAASRGIGRTLVVRKYILRNGLLPVVAATGTLLTSMLNGVVLVETVFGWPGIGKLTIDAIQHRDFPLLQAIVFVVAIITFAVNLVVDLTLAALDPRVRVTK